MRSIARSLEVGEVAAITAETRPDVALVGLGSSSEHALELISRIVQEAACPVIAVLETDDSDFVNEAAKRGIFGYISDGELADLRSAIDIVLRRFAEFQKLEGAFGRRAVTERAKGILMERHQIDEKERLRDPPRALEANGPQARGRGRGHRRQPPHASGDARFGSAGARRSGD